MIIWESKNCTPLKKLSETIIGMFQHRDNNYTAHDVKLRKKIINNELVGEMY